MCELPKVLAVILNYKTYKLTLEVVNKLKQLEYSNLDILVVDNFSPNESATVLEESASCVGFVFIKNSQNTGYAAGNNVGIRYAIEHGYIL